MKKELVKKLKETTSEFYRDLGLSMTSFLISNYPNQMTIEELKARMGINYKTLNKVLEENIGYYTIETTVEDQEERTTDDMFIYLDKTQFLIGLKKIEKTYWQKMQKHI